MKIVRLNETHQELYSAFVAAHKSGSFLQSWTWGAFQTEQGKEAIRYGVFENDEDDNAVDQTLLGTIQLLQTKIPRLPGTYVYAPYGPLISENHTDAQPQIISDLITKLKKDFAKAWFIRIEPKDDLHIDGRPTLHIQPGSTLTTDLTATQEELLSAMHPKTRYNIKVAAKHGVSVLSHLDKNFLSDPFVNQAISLLVDTSKRQGYKAHSAAYYKQLLEYFINKNQDKNTDCTAYLYRAVYNDQCIASAIMIDSGLTRTYLFGGSNNDQRSLMAPYALHWQAIQDAKQAGLTSYDWWGTETASGATPGFVQFKLRWGGTQKFYSGARDIVLNSLWYRAYTALRKVNRLF